MGFSQKLFQERRARVLEELGGGIMLIPSAPLLYRSRDTEHRYRPDSELFFLTGCTDPGVVAVLSGGGNDERFVLFVPERDPKAELWSGPRMGPEDARDRLGAQAAYPVSEIEERLPGLLRRSETILFRLGENPRLEGLVVDALRWARGRGSRTGEGPRRVEDPGTILDEFRLKKGPEEIAKVQQAASLTLEAFRVAISSAAPGVGEWEIEGLLEAEFRRLGAQGPAFPTIVATGANACILHYHRNGSTIGDGDLVLLDGGAEVGLYAGDVTRTFPARGRFTETQRNVYEIVQAAHGAALREVQPGNPVSRVHDAAVEVLTQGLRELKVLSGDLETLVREKAYEAFFPHQTSHWLGLDVHDVGAYARNGIARILEEGMVLTVEPGLYFSPAGDDRAGSFAGTGVRIEDDILVTAEGAKNLTEELPISPEGIEDLMGGG